MNPLHSISKADFEIFFEEICFRKIVRFSTSKKNLATGVTVCIHNRVDLQEFTKKTLLCWNLFYFIGIYYV